MMYQKAINVWEMDWSCDFYVNYWPDVIEEEALNEKSCIQVLRIMIAKSDNEIEGLEGELLFLETHLERADKNKAEEWFDICCKELNENIQSLELSIHSLKDGHVQNKNDLGVQSQTSREPAKKVRDIIKEASLRKELYVKQEPLADTTIEDVLDTVCSQFRNNDSINIKAEEAIESNLTAKDQITKEKMRLNQYEAMKVQEAAGVTDAVNTHFSDSSLVFQGQGNKNIVQLAQIEEPTPAPATHKTFRLIPSLKLQEQETKSIIPSEISKGQGKKARPNRKTAPKSTPKTAMKTPKAPTIPETPKSRTQSDLVVQKTGMSSVKLGGAKKRKQEQLDGQNFSSTRTENWFSSGNKVSRTVSDDVLKSGDVLTHSKTYLNSIFKTEEKTNSHGTMQLDAVEVKDPHGSLRTPDFGNLHSLKLQHVKDLAKSLGLKGVLDKRKDQIIKSIEEHKKDLIIKSIEEHKGRQL